MAAQALISVVTPVYNAEDYLAQCIESVLAQTYKNWEYLVVNNCSKDRTLEIARSYARHEARIRVITNGRFLSALENHNHALMLISPESKYCKILHADDWLYPECLEKMAEVAERHPRVGIVGSYALEGSRVRYDGLPYNSSFISGRQICRDSLLGGPYVFGTPSTVMYRSDIVRGGENFYAETYLHADTEVCYKNLRHYDFGFVHQVLVYSRVHGGQQSTILRKFHTHIPGGLDILKKYGRLYLTEDEYRKVLRRKLKNYFSVLGRNILSKKDLEFWRYHKKELNKLGYSLNPARLVIPFIRNALNQIFRY